METLPRKSSAINPAIGALLLLVQLAVLPAAAKPGRSFISLQYAGSIGLASAGFHIHNQRHTLEAGLIYGYTPDRSSPIHTATFKINVLPLRLYSVKGLEFVPLSAGFFLAKHFGDRFYWVRPDYYPEKYYWWNNSLRVHASLTTEIKKKMGSSPFDGLGIYLEANTNDLYFFSYQPNARSLRIRDIIFLGAGLKFYLD